MDVQSRERLQLCVRALLGTGVGKTEPSRPMARVERVRREHCHATSRAETTRSHVVCECRRAEREHGCAGKERFRVQRTHSGKTVEPVGEAMTSRKRSSLSVSFGSKADPSR